MQNINIGEIQNAEIIYILCSQTRFTEKADNALELFLNYTQQS